LRSSVDATRITKKRIAYFEGSSRPKRQLITTNLVLAEIHRLLLYRAGIQAAAAALAKIEASPLVRIEFAGEAHHQSAKRWIDRLNAYPISYTDAVSFAVMEASVCIEALSYDRHFRIAGFTIAKTLS
jgi:uncharacterized protein